MSSQKPTYRNFLQGLQNLSRQWQAAPKGGLICLWGPSVYCLLEGRQWLRRAWSQASDASVQLLENQDIQKAEQLANICQQRGMFDPCSLYLLPEVDKPADFVKKLQALSSAASLQNALCFSLATENLSVGLSKELTRLKSINIPCFPPPPQELPLFMQSMAVEYPLNLSREAQALLIQTAGEDLFKLANEWKKLSLIFHQGGSEATSSGSNSGPRPSSVSAEDLAPYLGYLRQDHAFALTDLLLQQQSEKAHLLLLDLLRRRESAIAILGVLTRHVRLALQAKNRQAQPMPSSQRLPASLLQKYSRYAAKLPETLLQQALCLCQEADMQLKSSGHPSDELLLAAIVLALRV